MIPSVKLTIIEKNCSILVGDTRIKESRASGLHNAHGLVISDAEDERINRRGAIAECGLAKYLNVFWCGSVNTFKTERDVAIFEVRSVDEEGHRLLVRKSDPDDAYFVCIAVVGNTCYIKGYLLGKDAKKEEWLNDYSGRPPAYFVPNSALKDPQGLKDLYLSLTK